MSNPIISVGLPSLPNPFRTEQEEVLFRERLLESTWYWDCWQELHRQLGEQRVQLVGTPDLSRNPAQRIYTSIGRPVYTPPPLMSGVPQVLVDLIRDYSGPIMADQYAEAGGAPMPSVMTSIESKAILYALCCGECGVMATWATKGERVALHLAKPSTLRGIEDPEDPGQPVSLLWHRPRKGVDTWEWWDLRRKPTYRVIMDPKWDNDGETPITWTSYDNGSMDRGWEDYPWVENGRPVIPGSILHRDAHAGLWDRTTGAELAQATLTLSVLLTHWGHGVKDANWVRPWILGGDIDATRQESSSLGQSSGPQPNVALGDLASVIRITADSNARTTLVGSWSPAFDPEIVLRAILAWEQALWGQILPVDLSSTGGDPMARLEEARKAYTQALYPQCREHDARVLLRAAVVARANGRDVADFTPGLLYGDEVRKALEPEEDSTDVADQEDSMEEDEMGGEEMTDA